MHLAQVPQPFDLGGVALGQGLRRRLDPRRVDGVHQRCQDTFHLLPNPGHPAITRFGQPPQLAQQVRPAAQAVFPGPVDHVPIADEDAGIAVLQGVIEHLPGAWADEVQRRRGTDQRPQPQQHAGFRPRRFIDVQLRHLHDIGHQGVLQREAGTAGFPDRLIDHAGAQRQVEDVLQELANTRSRQAHSQREQNDDTGQTRTHQAPFAELNLPPLGVGRCPPRLGTADVAASAAHFKQRVTRHVEHQSDGALDGRRDVDFVPGRVSLRLGLLRQRSTTNRAGLGSVRAIVRNCQFLRATMARTARLPARGFPRAFSRRWAFGHRRRRLWRRRRRLWRRRRSLWRWRRSLWRWRRSLWRWRRTRCRFGSATLDRRFVLHGGLARLLPRCLCARRPRAVGRVLIQPIL